MERRKFIRNVGTAGVIASAGCLGGGGGGGGKQVHFVTEENSTSAKQFFRNAAQQFEEETGIKVTPEFVGAGASFDQRIATLIRTGNAPEAAQVSGNIVTNWYRRDIVEPVTDIRESLEQEWNDQYDEDHRIVFDGEDYMVPMYLNIGSNTYRKDIFDQAGISPPTTWEEELDAWNSVQGGLDDQMSVGNYSFNDGFEGTLYSLSRIWGNGGRVVEHTGDGKEASDFSIVLDEGENLDRAAEALRHCDRLADFSPSPNMGPKAMISTYFTGRSTVGEYLGARPLRQALVNEYDAVGKHSRLKPITPSAGVSEPKNLCFSEGLSVLSESDNTEAGKQWLEFLLSGDRAIKILTELAPLHNAPTLGAHLETDMYQTHPVVEKADDQVLDTMKNDLIPNAVPFYNSTEVPNPHTGKLFNSYALGGMVSNVALGDTDPRTAVKQGAENLRDALNSN